jgi:hypothetical protein
MSKKLKKFLNDAEKTESKIAELEEYLRNVRAAQKKEEDNEIVRAIRSTKLGGRDLLALLENIQAGNVTFQTTASFYSVHHNTPGLHTLPDAPDTSSPHNPHPPDTRPHVCMHRSLSRWNVLHSAFLLSQDISCILLLV